MSSNSDSTSNIKKVKKEIEEKDLEENQEKVQEEKVMAAGLGAGGIVVQEEKVMEAGLGAGGIVVQEEKVMEAGMGAGGSLAQEETGLVKLAHLVREAAILYELMASEPEMVRLACGGHLLVLFPWPKGALREDFGLLLLGLVRLDTEEDAWTSYGLKYILLLLLFRSPSPPSFPCSYSVSLFLLLFSIITTPGSSPTCRGTCSRCPLGAVSWWPSWWGCTTSSSWGSPSHTEW